MKRWSGLYTPLVTPFKNGQLDEEGLKTLIHFQIENGVDGIVLLGTTGEAASLSQNEKERILKIARKEAGKLLLIVGTGSNATQTTIENTIKAEEEGADAALIITPYYVKPTQEGLLRHYEAIAAKSNLPIIVYNNTPRTGVNVETATLKKIAELPTVVGVKESSKNLRQIADVMIQIKKHRPSFSVLAGEDALILPILSLGADGAIASSANIAPRHVHALIHTCLQNNFTEARSLFFELFPLFEVLSIETNPIPLKYAMHCCGLPAGDPRLPLTPLAGDYRERVERVIKEIGL